VFKINEFKQEVEIENADNCSLCQECTKFATDVCGLSSKAVVIKENDQRFKFTVESTGALPPEEIVMRAIKILQRKINELSDGLAAPRYINI
jgi:DNA-directed RNA polymerase II subunit RPB3